MNWMLVALAEMWRWRWKMGLPLVLGLAWGAVHVLVLKEPFEARVLLQLQSEQAREPLLQKITARGHKEALYQKLTNPEVLALLRVPGAREWHSTAQGHRFVCNGPQDSWVAWLNTGDAPLNALLPAWLPDARRDCWARADLPAGTRLLTVPPHGARLVRCAFAPPTRA